MARIDYDGENIEKEVKKRVEEEWAHAKKMSSLIRTRQRGELKPKEQFFDAILEAQKELAEGLAFLERAEAQPALLFTESSRYLISTRGMIYTIMNHWKNESDPIKGHDFQVYLAHVANRYFQQWLREKGIAGNFTIEVRNANQFPSIFGVYHDETELIQFHLLEKWYGVRKRPLTKEQILQKDSENMERLLATVRTQERKVLLAIHRRDHTSQHYKGIKNTLRYFFLNKRRLHAMFDHAVKKEEALLIHYKVEMEREKRLLPKLIETAEEANVWIQQVEPFFTEIGYALEITANKLY